MNLLHALSLAIIKMSSNHRSISPIIIHVPNIYYIIYPSINAFRSAVVMLFLHAG